jgi:hypothetical protein
MQLRLIPKTKVEWVEEVRTVDDLAGSRTVEVNPLVRQFSGYTVSLPSVPRKSRP